MGGSINIVTGTPFASVDFNAGTDTFTIAGGDYRNMFNAGAIMTVRGTSSTNNNGYYEVVSSSFGAGDTTVTVQSYNVGTSYPGTVPFEASTGGNVIWFYAGGAVIVGPNYGNGANGRASGVAGGNFGSTTWALYAGEGQELSQNSSKYLLEFDGDLVLPFDRSFLRSDTNPWSLNTMNPLTNHDITANIMGPDADGNYVALALDPTNTFDPTYAISTDLVNWTDIGVPSGGFTPSTSMKLFTDGTTICGIFDIDVGGGDYDLKFTRINSTSDGWITPVTIISADPAAAAPVACVTGTATFAVAAAGNLYTSSNNGDSWSVLVDLYATIGGTFKQYTGIAYNSGTYYIHNGNNNGTIYSTSGGAPSLVTTPPSGFEGTSPNFQLYSHGTLVNLNGTVVCTGVMSYTGFKSVDAGTTMASTGHLTLGGTFVPQNVPSAYQSFNTLMGSNSATGAIGKQYLGGQYYSTVFDVFTSSTLTGTYSVANRTLPVYGFLRGVASDGNETVVTVTDSNVLYSTDHGLTWSRASLNVNVNPGVTPASPPYLMMDVISNGSIFVAVGDCAIATSPDGSTWTDNSIPSIEFLMTSIAWSPTLNVFAGIGYGDDTYAVSDDDTATSWTTSSPIPQLNKIRWLNDRFVIVGFEGIYYSTDGTTVTSAGTFSTLTFQDVAYGNGKYVVTGSDASGNDVMYVSSNGTSWSPATTDELPFNATQIIYANDQFVAVGTLGDGTDSIAYTSPDGITWTSNSMGSNPNRYVTALDWDGTYYVAGFQTFAYMPDEFPLNENMMRSTDGVTWSYVTTGVTNNILSLVAVNGVTVATCEEGLVLAEPSLI